MQTVAVIDYGMGNLHSVSKALERVGAGRVLVTSDAAVIREADRVVFPGVGAIRDCMAEIRRLGFDALVREVSQDRPFLGICVGMQLMATRGIEYGVHNGLGWIEGEVRIIEPLDPALKIPHMGWNTLVQLRPHPLLDGIPTGEKGLHAYFVHSYALNAENEEDVIARTDYGGPVTAIVGRDNMAGTQFHPEKSQALGLKLIGNFLKWRP